MVEMSGDVDCAYVPVVCVVDAPNAIETDTTLSYVDGANGADAVLQMCRDLLFSGRDGGGGV